MRTKIAVGIGVLALIGACGWFLHLRGGTASIVAFNSDTTDPSLDGPPPLATSVPPTSEVGQGTREYQNAAFHFKIDFPDTLQVTEYKERDNAVTVTFMNSDNSQSFEIYVTPFAGTQIDQTRFKIDEPSGRYLDPQNVVIGNTQATLFTGYNPIMGDTREVWFVKNGYLYEVATYKDLDSWLGTIMQSFKFI